MLRAIFVIGVLVAGTAFALSQADQPAPEAAVASTACTVTAMGDIASCT